MTVIESKEEYELIKTRDEYERWKMAYPRPRMVATIEALREVARAANRMNIQLKGLPHAPLTKALAALPDWITED